MNRQLKGLAAGAFMALATTACYDLSVRTTFDELTRDAVLEDPALIENVLAGTGINLWAAMQNHGRPWVALEAMGERITSSTDVNLVWQTGQEPRRAMENAIGQQAINSTPWALFYEANSAAAEMQRHMRDNNVRIIDPLTNNDQTNRAIAWAKFVQGTSHGYLGILFDRAAIVNMDVDLSQVPVLPLAPYTEVRDSALKWLNEAAVLAETNTFVMPYTNALWFWNTTLSNVAFAQIVHSMIARVMVYSARTPEEREAIAWGPENQPGTVLYHVARSISSDFGPGGDGTRPNTLLTYEYKAMVFAPVEVGGGNVCAGRTLGHSTRIDMRLLGPADTVMIDTNNDGVPDKTRYQEWLEKVATEEGRDTTVGFVINGPDTRIGFDETEDSPSGRQDIPIYFRVTSLPITGDAPGAGTPIQPAERGLYYRESRYYSSSMLDQQGRNGGRNTNAELADIPDIGIRVVEMKLLKAEALYRTGDLQGAADIVNETRANGDLPTVSTSGPPVGPGCVPKRYDGSCGDLWDALMYEKRIETFGSHGLIPWADGRGWGCLLAGTVTEFPIPARQLDLMGEPVYTFGGQPGERGSAPAPTNCPMLFNPTAG